MEQSSSKIFSYITNDFEKAWNALADENRTGHGGGNYTFAFISMLFLEWVSYLIPKNSTDVQLKFVEALRMKNKAYFIQLNKSCKIKNSFIKIIKPPPISGSYLIQIIFDSIRNGHGHTYFQNIFTLSDGKYLTFQIQGPVKKIDDFNADDRKHLHVNRDANGDLVMYFNPAAFYLDIKEVVKELDLCTINDSVKVVSKGTLNSYSTQDLSNLFIMENIYRVEPAGDVKGATGSGINSASPLRK